MKSVKSFKFQVNVSDCLCIEIINNLHGALKVVKFWYQLGLLHRSFLLLHYKLAKWANNYEITSCKLLGKITL